MKSLAAAYSSSMRGSSPSSATRDEKEVRLQKLRAKTLKDAKHPLSRTIIINL